MKPESLVAGLMAASAMASKAGWQHRTAPTSYVSPAAPKRTTAEQDEYRKAMARLKKYRPDLNSKARKKMARRVMRNEVAV